jgi:hypothetical protein
MVQHLIDAVARNRTDAGAWRSLGEALARRGQHQEALLALDNAVHLGDRAAERARRSVRRDLERACRRLDAQVDVHANPWPQLARFGPGGPDALRPFFTRRFAWAVPSPEVIEALAAFAGGDRILEVGAGLGLWARLLREAGADVVATDDFSTHHRERQPMWTEVAPLRDHAALAAHPDAAVLFSCWPPADGALLGRAAAAFRGDRLAVIGEAGDGAVTGTSRLEGWSVRGSVPIVRWPGFEDHLTLYHRASRVPT